MRGDVELNLAKCPHHVADLADRDLAVATLVVQQERFLADFNKTVTLHQLTYKSLQSDLKCILELFQWFMRQLTWNSAI